MFSWKRPGPAEWLVVGLGNPGPKYEWTRHNVGFLVIDQLADRENLPVQRLKHKALTNTALIGGKPVLLMKPTTYMNLSGEAVGEAARFLQNPPRPGAGDLRRCLPAPGQAPGPPERVRRRAQRAEKHHCPPGHRPVPRIKVGVGGKPHPDSDMADWVLSSLPAPTGRPWRPPSPGPPTR